MTTSVKATSAKSKIEVETNDAIGVGPASAIESVDSEPFKGIIVTTFVGTQPEVNWAPASAEAVAPEAE